MRKLALLGLLMATAAGCNTYEVWQADNYRHADFKPAGVHKVAVVTFVPFSEVGGEKIEHHGSDQTLDRNKTFGEAMIMCLQQRGIRIVEQQMVEVVQKEARLAMSKDADVISTKDLTGRIGKQLGVDTVIYCDSTGRQTFYQFQKKFFKADEDEAAQRQRDANQRGGLTPDDVSRCNILVHHYVGLSVRAIDVASGKIVWVGYRSLATGQQYDSDRPDSLSQFGAVQKLTGEVCNDMLGRS